MGTRIDIAPKPDELELPPPGFSLAPIPPADVSAAFRLSRDTPIWDQMIIELGGFNDQEQETTCHTRE